VGSCVTTAGKGERRSGRHLGARKKRDLRAHRKREEKKDRATGTGEGRQKTGASEES